MKDNEPPFLYPEYDDVLKDHDERILMTGGTLGVISPSNLQYILDRVHDEGANLKEKQAAVIRKAGYLLYNLIRLHPFADGNRRTAFSTTDRFLVLRAYPKNTFTEDIIRGIIGI